MIFQSRFNTHTFIIRPTTRAYNPVTGHVQINNGLRAEFRGPQRLFDSELAQEYNDWSDEERKQVEDFLLKNKAFGVDIFIAPGQEVDEEAVSKMRVKPTEQVRRCLYVIAYRGEIKQCENQASFGKDYCNEHDPDRPQIIKGAVEQK